MLSILLKQLDNVFTGASDSRNTNEKASVTRHEKIVEHLYKKYADDIFHFALTLTDYATAQDLSHKLWLKLLEHPEKFKQQKNFKAYMFSSVRNSIFDEYKRSNKLSDLTTVNNTEINNDGPIYGEKHPPVHASDLDNKCIADEFNDALTQLPFYQREAFCLQQEGFTVNDISSITNTPPETIKTRLRYAKQRLQHLLEEYHVGE